jgi:hypothetical protein
MKKFNELYESILEEKKADVDEAIFMLDNNTEQAERVILTYIEDVYEKQNPNANRKVKSGLVSFKNMKSDWSKALDILKKNGYKKSATELNKYIPKIDFIIKTFSQLKRADDELEEYEDMQIEDAWKDLSNVTGEISRMVNDEQKED